MVNECAMRQMRAIFAGTIYKTRGDLQFWRMMIMYIA